MTPQDMLLQALHDAPDDRACWLALADALEEAGRAGQAELLRLRLELQGAGGADRAAREARLRGLMGAGAEVPAPRLVNSVGMSLTLVPAGSFLMGSPGDEPGRHPDEGPRHVVRVTRAFYLGTYPVTQAEYQAVMGTNPSHFRRGGDGWARVRGIDTGTLPVDRVAWDEAVAFCGRLSARPEERAAGQEYRLPTEAEWEYACRAGTTTLYYCGDALSSEQANIDGNLPEGEAERGRYLARTCPVGSYAPNPFGLYDMHGNVWEWCSDWFDDDYYQHSPVEDPPGPADGTRRAMRGGGWFYGARISRSAYRYRYEPEARHNDFGMRVAMTVRRGAPGPAAR